MPAEAAFSFNARSPQGEQITLRGDTWTELRQNVIDMFGDPEVADEFLERFVATAAGRPAPVTEAQAVQNVQNAFPGSTVGTVPQPQPAAQPAASGEPQAGEVRIIDGVAKKWVPAGFSQKKQKAYKGFWGNA